MVMAAEEKGIREGRRAPVGPVRDVVRLAEAGRAAGEAAAAVPEVQGPAERGRDGPGAASEVQELAALAS